MKKIVTQNFGKIHMSELSEWVFSAREKEGVSNLQVMRDGEDFSLFGDREETDDEYSARTKKRPIGVLTIEEIMPLDLNDMPLAKLAALNEEYGDKYLNLRISGIPYGYDGGREFVLVGNREETHEEHQARVEVEARKAKITRKKTVKSHARVIAQLILKVEQIMEESGEDVYFDVTSWTLGWLVRPSHALGGKKPIDFIEDVDFLMDLLERNRSGAFS